MGREAMKIEAAYLEIKTWTETKMQVEMTMTWMLEMKQRGMPMNWKMPLAWHQERKG
jgi:hypothetical protein